MNRDSPHLGRNHGGHWWQPDDEEPPEWYFNQLVPESTRHDSPSQDRAPDLPDDLDWTDYRSYNCVICQDTCINRTDSEASENNECWACLDLPQLD